MAGQILSCLPSGHTKNSQQHNEALADSSQAVIDILESPPEGEIGQILDADLEASGEYDGGDWVTGLITDCLVCVKYINQFTA